MSYLIAVLTCCAITALVLARPQSLRQTSRSTKVEEARRLAEIFDSHPERFELLPHQVSLPIVVVIALARNRGYDAFDLVECNAKDWLGPLTFTAQQSSKSANTSASALTGASASTGGNSAFNV